MCIEYRDLYLCDEYRAFMMSMGTDAPYHDPCLRCKNNTNRK